MHHDAEVARDDQAAFAARDPAAHPPALAPIYRSSLLRAPRQPLLSLRNTLSEVTGPVFGESELGPLDADLLGNHAQGGAPIGERIILHGRVLDGDARPVPGVLVEIWQANAGGRYRHANDSFTAALDPNFGGCGRAISDAEGRYRFRTIRPGPYPFPNRENDWRPAHIHYSVFGQGFAQRLITQSYFEGDPLIAHDAILGTMPDAVARQRLVARLDMAASVPFEALAWRFDIVLRGRAASRFEGAA
ncbi:MAG TPA: protocatechuate 3,4-dioxygenase subunit beta [Roseomonas sp.]|jgi:protocatechuate 3,4-dioxygenase beta subunit